MERRNGHYSDQIGHLKRGLFARKLTAIIYKNPNQLLSRDTVNIGLQREMEFVIRRSMLRTPADGRR